LCSRRKDWSRALPNQQKDNLHVFVPHSFDVVDVARCGSSSLIQTRPTSDGSSGYRNTFVFSDGILASWASIDRNQRTEERYDSNGCLKIHVRMDGVSVVTSRDADRHAVPNLSCTALVQPLGTQKIEIFDSGDHERSVTVSCSRNFLVNDIGLDPDEFSGPLRQFLQTGSSDFRLLNAGYSLGLKQAAEAFFESEGNTVGRKMLLQSRALDIVRLFLERMKTVDDARSHARPQDRIVIAKVIDILERTYARPPSAVEIAASVGVSLSKLMKLFKAIEQKTISDYLIEIRMRRALELIQDGKLSITQIAFEVGYEHSANFSTAFRRVFGMSPRDVVLGDRANLPPGFQA